MAALQCEICGGKLMAKSGGLFECEYCGMQYDKLRIQEMVQEIKGTVKVEGTVEVKGTVKIDGPIRVEGSVSKENLLERGNLALADGHWKDAEDFFDRVLNLEPHSAQAYLGKYMARMNATDFESLKERYAAANDESVSHSYLKRAKEFADTVLAAQLAEMDDLRTATRSSLEGVNQSVYSKVNNSLYYTYSIAAAKTLDHTLLIDGQHTRFEGDSYENPKKIPFSDKWYDINKVFGTWEYASTCPGGQEVYDHIEPDSDGILAIDHTGNVCVTHWDQEWNEKLENITNKWTDVEVVLSLCYCVLAKNHFGKVYWATSNGEEQEDQQKVANWENVVHIALNEIGAFGLTKEGRIYFLPFTWVNGETILAEMAYWTDIRQIIVGQNFVAGLTGQGDVKLNGISKSWDNTYDIVQSVSGKWKRVRHLDSANGLTCIFEDGTACNVHDGELSGDWSSVTKIYHDGNDYYGVGGDGSVCVGWKAPLPDNVIKEMYECRLFSNGTLTGVKTKKKVLNFIGDLAGENGGMVLYEDGTVDVWEEGKRSRNFRTAGWKLFKSSETFEQEYQQGLQKKRSAQENYEKAVEQRLAEIEEESARQKEKQRADEYEKACTLLDKKQSEIGLKDALSIFEELKDYRDSGEKLILCQAVLAKFREQELLRKKQTQYQKACNAMKCNTVTDLQQAIWIFKNLDDWKDSTERAQRCNEKINILKRRDSLQGQKKNLEKELDGLGLFARKRKKEIAAEIHRIDQEMTQIEKELE